MTSVLKWGSKKGGKPQESGTGKTWIHSSEALQQGSVVYAVKEEMYTYPLHRISYCADDKRDKKVFAFIAKDSGAQHHNCYVFECEKMAEELTLTVGQAFDLAYRRFLEKKAVNQHSQKKLTEMEEKIKTAEEEKEALKQKIAQLEVAAKQGPPSSNGSNEGSRSQSDFDEFDLLGGFGGVAANPVPPSQEAFLQETAPSPQEAFPQEMAGQEMIFDPFAEIPPQPQTTVPTSPDFNEFSPQPMASPPPMAAPAPRPPAMGLLPPSANKTKLTSPSPTTTVAPLTTTPQPAPSDDLLQLGSSTAFSKNPFSSGINGADPFSDHAFDPLASKDAFLNGNKEINQNNIQGFPGKQMLKYGQKKLHTDSGSGKCHAVV
ncbi:hypothetical protein ACROYT_G024100 [Oculina patagonica]